MAQGEVDKYVRVPFSNEDNARVIKDELTAQEMAQALIDAVKDKREWEEKDPEEIDAHNSMESINEAEENGLISPERAEQLRIVGRRRGLSRF